MPTYTFSTLNDPLATRGTFATGINDAGQIAGYYQDSTVAHSFLYSGGSYTTLDDPLATGLTVDSGEIVGFFTIVARSWRRLSRLFASVLISATLLFSSQLALAQFSQQGPKLVGTGAVGSAEQGLSVALSADGNTAIVGGFNDNGGTGAAWVYTRSGGVWTQQGSKLVGTGAVGTAYQGFSVALSGDGNTAIVGGRNDNAGTGAAWVYTRSGGVWTQQGSKLVGTGAVGNANQGYSVALSADGNTAIVGGIYDGATGAAWVFVAPRVRFLAFSATLTIDFGDPPPEDTFNLHSSFTLSSTASIDPVTEPVTLKVGTFTTTIPPGSFSKHQNGSFTFVGVIGGVKLNALIKPTGTLRDAFQVTAKRASLTGTTNPVPVALTGDDSGMISVTAHISP